MIYLGRVVFDSPYLYRRDCCHRVIKAIILKINKLISVQVNKYMHLCMKIFSIFSLIFPLLLSCAISSARAESISLINDAEIESVLKSYVKPMFMQNGIPPDAVKIMLVKDNTINAFATTHYTIFVHTGLITSANSAGEVMGVLAHETGHIAGGHLVRLYDNIKIANTTSLISTILGTTIALISGRPDVGLAVIMGGNSAAVASHMRYRQSEENAADEMAVKTLHKNGYSIQGFLRVMKKLAEQDKIALDNSNQSYLRTHPLSEDRVSFLNNALLNEKNTVSIPINDEKKFQRIKAKLIGFLYPPAKVQMMYRKTDDSFPARYANVIADFRMGAVEQALKELNDLIAENPKDPYLRELKGQVLFENGRVKEAVEEYRLAVKYAENEPLIKLGLALALVEANDKKMDEEALHNLEQLVEKNRDIPEAWRLLSIVYARLDDMGMTYYSMAEYNLLLGDYESANDYAEKAKLKLKQETTRYIKLLDLMSEIETKMALRQ